MANTSSSVCTLVTLMKNCNTSALQLTCAAQVSPAPSRRGLTVLAAAKTAGSTVRIIIQGRKLPVTDAIKSYIEGKVRNVRSGGGSTSAGVACRHARQRAGSALLWW